MYLRTDPETRLGQVPQVFVCTVDAIILDDFQVGDYRLRPSHYEKLMAIREIAIFARNAGRPISVALEGFTDSSGKEVMNKGLSVSRAAEVQNFLVKVGVDVHRAEGRGEPNPKADNGTEVGRRKNRRVELRLCVLQPPPPPGGSYTLKVSNLLRQVGYQRAALLARPPLGRGLGDAPTYTPWRARLGMRPKPQYLRFLNLDQFDWNKASLTARLRQMVAHLAKHVQQSWKTMQPIAYIRLIGHTDNTGPENYNVDLGDRRAQAVKEELENILKEDIHSGRIRMAILVERSPGKSAPAADNRTPQGRALNRRVEVFIEPPVLQLSPPPPPPQPPTGISEETKKRMEEEGKGVVRPPYRPKSSIPFEPIPSPRPPKSPRERARDKAREYLRSMRVPERIHNTILNLAEKGLWTVVDQTLQAADIGSGARQAIVGTMQGIFRITF
jgi:outer membrane protein OmpA-like peptidoglycan-associated protein